MSVVSTQAGRAATQVSWLPNKHPISSCILLLRALREMECADALAAQLFSHLLCNQNIMLPCLKHTYYYQKTDEVHMWMVIQKTGNHNPERWTGSS